MWEETSILSEIRAEKWVYGGDALARLDGRVVLAPFVMPGETARVEMNDGLHADLREVLEPSSERVAPPCPIFGRCGGCHYQEAPYEFQLARKIEILREQFRRVGKIEYAGPVETIAAEPLGYRNRIQVHFEDDVMGYLAPRSHTIVPLEGDCPIASPRLNVELARFRERLRDSRFPRFLRSIELFTNEKDMQINALETDRPLARWFFDWCESAGDIQYPTASGNFRVSPRSFFQVNRFLIDRLVDSAIAEERGESALDLYAGAGLFAIPLAARFKKVTAVEAVTSAVRDLEFNAKSRLVIEKSRVEDYLAKIGETPEFVLADPPRTGLGKVVTTHLERLRPHRLTIVSCDPATLARDLAALPHYTIDRVTLADLFPQTYHIETIVHLKRISNDPA